MNYKLKIRLLIKTKKLNLINNIPLFILKEICFFSKDFNLKKKNFN